MKTVVLLAALVALAVAGTVPAYSNIETKPVDAEFVLRQNKILTLLETIEQIRKDAEYYKIGLEYNVQANADKYSSKKAVDEFLLYYKSGFLPKHRTFSVFYDRMREEAAVLFELLYSAKDFDTFYNTAAFARVHLNEGQFVYAFYIAVFHRADCEGLILPAPFEMYPQYFVNSAEFYKAYRVKMQNGIVDSNEAAKYGIVKEGDKYIVYANYSAPYVTGSEEQRLAYFTEDIGMSAYYYYFQSVLPFWFKSSGTFEGLKQYRGEFNYFVYQQLIARYYLERLSNDMGEIPQFSWNEPIKTGYACSLSSYYPFFQRNDYYQIVKEENYEELQYLNSYEQTFLYFLEQGHFKAYNQEIDLHNSKAINFVGNYWFTNVDLYEKSGPRHYERYYELIARRLLSGVPDSANKYLVIPSALELYQTSLRDPVFYQFYKRILNYIVQYKEYLEPYSHSQLSYDGVKVADVTVDKLVTFFENYDFDVSNDLYYSAEEIKGDSLDLRVRQPRLNKKPFTISLDIKASLASDAVVKVFLGPKYDSNGYPISIEDNWMNFVLLDWFKYKLESGQNKIERKSADFWFFKDDSIPMDDLREMLKQGKVPVDMADNFFMLPERMMLPKGTKGGFPFQLYVVVYPYTALPEELAYFKGYYVDAQPIGYPFDRPIYEPYFVDQPNIYQEDVLIYHEGVDNPNFLNVPQPLNTNAVPKQ